MLTQHSRACAIARLRSLVPSLSKLLYVLHGLDSEQVEDNEDNEDDEEENDSSFFSTSNHDDNNNNRDDNGDSDERHPVMSARSSHTERNFCSSASVKESGCGRTGDLDSARDSGRDCHSDSESLCDSSDSHSNCVGCTSLASDLSRDSGDNIAGNHGSSLDYTAANLRANADIMNESKNNNNNDYDNEGEVSNACDTNDTDCIDPVRGACALTLRIMIAVSRAALTHCRENLKSGDPSAFVSVTEAFTVLSADELADLEITARDHGDDAMRRYLSEMSAEAAAATSDRNDNNNSSISSDSSPQRSARVKPQVVASDAGEDSNKESRSNAAAAALQAFITRLSYLKSQ